MNLFALFVIEALNMYRSVLLILGIDTINFVSKILLAVSLSIIAISLRQSDEVIITR